MHFEVEDLGRISYEDGWTIQANRLEEILAGTATNTLFLVEHEPVLTLGAAYHSENLLLTEEEYQAKGIDLKRTERGGDVTYHGPGQLVAYPVFDLNPLGRDLHKWLRTMEEAVIQTLSGYGLGGERNAVNTGVWIENRKICAMGIKVRRWVSMHGLALNCNTDLSAFATIVPCGIRGAYGVTSISQELGHEVTIGEVKPKLVEAFRQVLP